MLHFRNEGDAEPVLHGNDYLVFKSRYLFRSRLPRDIDNHQRLLFIDTDIAFPVPFLSALFDEPCRRDLYEARTCIEMRYRIILAVFAFGVIFDKLI